MLLPVFALMAVSGYNLSAGNNTLAVVILHLIVMAVCLFFVAMIVRSMFAIKYVEAPQPENRQAYEELNLQHS